MKPAADRSAKRRRSLAAGHGAEWAALLYLRAKGYRILARRYLVKGGEIDIIARRGEALVFIEVKLRQAIETAQISIGAEKRRRIARAARAYLSGNEGAMRLVLRADAIYLAPWRWPLHLENAFELDLDRPHPGPTTTATSLRRRKGIVKGGSYPST